MQLDALGLFLVAYGTLAQAGHLAPDTGLVRARPHAPPIAPPQPPPKPFFVLCTHDAPARAHAHAPRTHTTRTPARGTHAAADGCHCLPHGCRRFAQVTRFVRYLAAIEYWQRPDLGHWEEWPAMLRTSSLGCCVAGLRAVAPLLSAEEREELGVDALASRGADALTPRLGGAGGGAHAWEAAERADDAAMLTLLLPPIAAQLSLSDAQRAAVVASALRLRRAHGVLRYEADSYYGADYQARLRAWKREHGGGDAGAYPQPHVRNSWAVPGCEAQWTIFEPLLLLHFLHMHAQRGATGSSGGSPTGADTAAEVRRSLMRILAAVEEAPAPPGSSSGGGSSAGGDAGSGAEDVRLHVHESYAVVAGARGPNDVQDLLWAVAYIRMALAACADALRSADVPPFV
jgi:hypothetical protein